MDPVYAIGLFTLILLASFGAGVMLKLAYQGYTQAQEDLTRSGQYRTQAVNERDVALVRAATMGRDSWAGRIRGE